MIIGERLRKLREQKKLTQGDVEERTRLARAYISRVENGHTVPAVETLEKFARALEIPIHELFYDGDKPLKFRAVTFKNTGHDNSFGARGKEAVYLHKLRRLLARIDEDDRQILLTALKRMAARGK
jgi:transcriptional regulator with XRE-family HTH domain